MSKYYIEDFYTFCSNLGGDSSEIMCSLLSARADRAAINITLNSFGTPLNEPHMRDTLRKRLYPSIGELYPAGTDLLSRADDEQKLTDSLRAYQEYHPILEKMTSLSADEYSIDDAFYKKEGMYEITSIILHSTWQYELSIFFYLFPHCQCAFANSHLNHKCILVASMHMSS